MIVLKVIAVLKYHIIVISPPHVHCQDVATEAILSHYNQFLCICVYRKTTTCSTMIWEQLELHASANII